MSDEQQPTTKEIPAVDPVLELLKEVRTEVRSARADISLVSNDVTIVKDRVGLVEQRVGVLEEARSRASDGVRQLSVSDASQDAEIADMKAWRATVDGKLDTIHGVAVDIKGALVSPLGRQALKAVAVLLIAAATTVAGYTAGHEQQPKQEHGK